MTFDSFNLHPEINAGIRSQGYTVPTPIQTRAIPEVLSGRDVMGLAQTGTGKTAAFVLPILQRLMGVKRGRLKALVIAPTRELAEQINDVVKSLGAATGIRTHTVYGGVGMEPQVQRLRQGYEICVACPGRLLDHINQGTVDLSALEVLVLDEADQMFDMGFFPTIRRILKHLPKERQNLYFSATMPEDIRTLAREVLKDPVTVQVDNIRPASTVAHALYPVAQDQKTTLLMQLLAKTDAESMLIFTRTKHRTKRLAKQLETAGYSVTSLQGNLSQNKRQAALAGFRDGSYQIMVATDIAARGIDVSQVSHVINYDIPNTVEAYTHRIGRTGRAARTGDAFTFVSAEDAPMVRAIEKVLGAKIERRQLEGFDASARVEELPERPERPAAPLRNRPARRPETRGESSQGDSRQSHRHNGQRHSGRPPGSRSDRNRAGQSQPQRSQSVRQERSDRLEREVNGNREGAHLGRFAQPEPAQRPDVNGNSVSYKPTQPQGGSRRRRPRPDLGNRNGGNAQYSHSNGNGNGNGSGSRQRGQRGDRRGGGHRDQPNGNRTSGGNGRFYN